MPSQESDKPSIKLSQLGPFEHLFKDHYALVCNVVYKYVGDKSKAEDLAQEIFTELWVKRDQVSIHTSVPAYLRRMAVSRALNYLRDNKKYDWDDLDLVSESIPNTGSQQPEVIQQLEEAELKNLLDRAISQLPEKCRIVFLLSRQDELSYSEIAQNLNISIKTVENQIGKALKYLRTALVGNRG